MVSTFDLFRWCAEIGNGLKFLASIRVIHGGTCAKNVYLSEEKVAKLYMPTLPRQLNHYTMFDKTSEVGQTIFQGNISK
jgi:hypothetical protein